MSRSEYIKATSFGQEIEGDAAADFAGDLGSLEEFVKKHGVDCRYRKPRPR